jgi:hypothetical protein
MVSEIALSSENLLANKMKNRQAIHRQITSDGFYPPFEIIPPCRTGGKPVPALY